MLVPMPAMPAAGRRSKGGRKGGGGSGWGEGEAVSLVEQVSQVVARCENIPDSAEQQVCHARVRERE